MQTSFFSELMDSYAGIRKRTWKPAYILEAEKKEKVDINKGFKLLKKLIGTVASNPSTPVIGGKPGEEEIDKRYRIESDPDNEGINIITPRHPKGVTVMDQTRSDLMGRALGPTEKGVLQVNKKYQATSPRSAMGQYASYLAGGKENERRAGGAVQDPTGGDEPEEETQAERDAEGKRIKQEVQGTDEKFEQHHKDSITVFLTSKAGGGLTPKEAAKKIVLMERQINFPYANTNVFYGMAVTLGTRPDFGTDVKKEILAAVGDLYEAASKIQKITVDGVAVRVITEGSLRGCMGQATQLTTVRGAAGDKGVFVGRGTASFEKPCFPNLQEFTAKYDHQAYGATFGGVLGTMAKSLLDVVVIPTGAVMDTIGAENIQAWRKGDESGRLLTRRSLSVENIEGTDDVINHYKGLIQEDIFELISCNISGDKAGRAAAMVRLRKNIQAGADMASYDLDDLESALLSDEFMQLQSLQRLEDLGLPPNETLRLILQQAAVHSQRALLQLGLSEGQIKRVERPSKESKIGEKSDVDIVLEDHAHLDPRWDDAVWDRPVLGPEGEKMKDPVTDKVITERVLSVSIKFYDSLNSNTVVGTCSAFKAYGAGASDISDTPRGRLLRDKGRAEADTLHRVCLDDLRSTGSITPEQEKSMMDALDIDREEWKRLEGPNGFGSFTKVNNAQMTSYIESMIEALSEDGGVDKPGYEAQLKELEDIQRSLKETSEGTTEGKAPRGPDATAGQQAAQKIWQLGRIQRAAKDTEYARAMALNDMILSSQTYEPEIQLKGATGVLRLDNNRENLRAVASACFSETGRGSATATQTSIYAYDKASGKEVPLFHTGVRAKTVGDKGSRRKQCMEGKQTHHGARLTAYEEVSRVGSQQSIAAPEEDPEESTEGETLKAESQEPEEPKGSNFEPILKNLPAVETGEVQRMGAKMIAILKPFCLKVKCSAGEYEGGFMSKEKAEKAFHLLKQLSVEFEEKIDVKVKDYKWHRTFS